MNRSDLLVASVLLVAACGGSTNGGTPVALSSSLATPQPLTVQVSLDTTKATSAVIGPIGGEITASAASGATLTLTVPTHALLSPHTITLTPLASVSGLPLKGGLLAGAQLSPDGLLLAKPAHLKITLPKPPSSGMNAYAFGYRHNGTELHLVPKAGSGMSVTLTIWHFSGAGVGSGTSSDASSQAANHAPTAPQDQVEQAQALGLQILPLLLGWEAELGTQLGQSPPDLALLDAIYQQLMIFEPLAIAADRPDLPPALYSKMALVLQIAATLALDRCRSVPDASEGMRVIRWIEWAQAHPLLLQHLDTASLEGAVVKCLRFRLDFTTTIGIQFPPEAFQIAVESKNIAVNAVSAIPLTFASEGGDITYDSYTWTVPAPVGYTVSTSTIRQFSVKDVVMNLDASESADASAVVDSMNLVVDFGDTSETLTIRGASGQAVAPLRSIYADSMLDLHLDSGVGPNLFRIAPWTAGTPPIFAVAHQTCPCGSPPNFTITQDTLFQLRQTPL
jgi:hypothetical protein